LLSHRQNRTGGVHDPHMLPPKKWTGGVHYPPTSGTAQHQGVRKLSTPATKGLPSPTRGGFLLRSYHCQRLQPGKRHCATHVRRSSRPSADRAYSLFETLLVSENTSRAYVVDLVDRVPIETVGEDAPMVETVARFPGTHTLMALTYSPCCSAQQPTQLSGVERKCHSTSDPHEICDPPTQKGPPPFPCFGENHQRRTGSRQEEGACWIRWISAPCGKNHMHQSACSCHERLDLDMTTMLDENNTQKNLARKTSQMAP